VADTSEQDLERLICTDLRRPNQPAYGVAQAAPNASYFAFTATPKNKTL